MQKSVQSAYNLRIPTGDCILFPFSGAEVQFFGQRPDPKMRLGWLALKLVHYSGEKEKENGTMQILWCANKRRSSV